MPGSILMHTITMINVSCHLSWDCVVEQYKLFTNLFFGDLLDYIMPPCYKKQKKKNKTVPSTWHPQKAPIPPGAFCPKVSGTLVATS